MEEAVASRALKLLAQPALLLEEVILALCLVLRHV